MNGESKREYFVRRDTELGDVLRDWSMEAGFDVEGPLEAPGMDPTWIARFRTAEFEADLMVFYGPHIDVSAFRPEVSASGYLVGGEDDVSDERFVEMLNDLASAARGGPDPTWMRFVST